MQLLNLRSNDVPELKKWLTDSQYQSSNIISELVKTMGHTVLHEIIGDINKARFFAILADETRDISNAEQLNIVIRWVSEAYEVNEDPIGMVKVPKTTADILYKTILDVLTRCSLPLENCRGQGYDGASNMSGYRQEWPNKLWT